MNTGLISPWGGSRSWVYKCGSLTLEIYFLGFQALQAGLHLCLAAPNIEIHFPFGFIRAGRKAMWDRTQ